MNTNRRKFMQAAGGIATLGIIGAGSATASPATLTNAEVTSSGAIVATGDNFVIAGHELTVDGSRGSPVISNNGYSGEIYGNTLTVESIGGRTFGISVQGGDVDVYDNTVDAVDNLGPEFLAVGFTDGATGSASGNVITGRHRVGVLARGPGTDVDISRNTIVGIGPISTGWAENGIQVSGGATANVDRNTVDDHWWDLNNFLSSGIIVYGAADVNIQRNSLENNDAGIALFGERNNAIHNDLSVTYTDTDTFHYGVVEYAGVDNGMRQNTITAAGDDDAQAGIYAGGDNTKLIRNDISGWQTDIAAPGDDTKLPKPFDPSS